MLFAIRSLIVAAMISHFHCGFAASQEQKTDIRPLVIQRPDNPVALKFELGISVTFQNGIMAVNSVKGTSPLLEMRKPAFTRSHFEIEKGDQIIAIKDGWGRFIATSHRETVAFILNSLSTSKTQVLVRDVNDGLSWVYDIDLSKAANNNVPGNAPAPQDKKVVVLLLGDSNDDSVGDSVGDTIGWMHGVFDQPTQRRHLRKATVQENANNGLKTDIATIVKGEDFSRSSILQTINGLQVGPNDALFCFINCHGAHDPMLKDYSSGHYFNMPDGKNLTRIELRSALDRKNARLTILISESCNVGQPFDQSETDTRTVSASEDDLSIKNMLFESLLLESKGVVDFNSSSEGEYSFTSVFSPILYRSLAYRKQTSATRLRWSVYVETLSKLTSERYRIIRQGLLAEKTIDSRTRSIFAKQENQTLRVYQLSD